MLSCHVIIFCKTVCSAHPDGKYAQDLLGWRFGTGSPWRGPAGVLGPWQTVWKRLDRWTRDGTWDRLLAAPQTDAQITGELDWVASADCSVVRAHQHAASARPIDGDNELGHTGSGVE